MERENIGNKNNKKLSKNEVTKKGSENNHLYQLPIEEQLECFSDILIDIFIANYKTNDDEKS